MEFFDGYFAIWVLGLGAYLVAARRLAYFASWS